MGSIDDLWEEPQDEFLQTEQELKREIGRLTRLAKKTEKWHEKEISTLREQIRELLEKNMDLTETNNLFARGIDRLREEHNIITQSHPWKSKGLRGLKERIEDLVGAGKRIVSIVPMHTDSHGYTDEAVIVTEHIEKIKPRPSKLFKEQ